MSHNGVYVNENKSGRVVGLSGVVCLLRQQRRVTQRIRNSLKLTNFRESLGNIFNSSSFGFPRVINTLL